jgi:hypothetical protein
VPVTRSFIVGSDRYFGERGALRFDDQIVAARRGGGTYLELPKRTLPGNPQWMLPGAVTLPIEATRQDTIRFYARPKSTRIGTRVDRYALSYFRIVVGLSSPEGITRWTHTARAPFLGGATGDQTVVLCDAAGDIRWLDIETGAVIMRRSLHEAVVACAVQSTRPRRGDTPQNPLSLGEQLIEAISAPGDELVPLQLELLNDLSTIETGAASLGLMQLAVLEASGSPDRALIGKRAAELLSERNDGLEVLVNALASTSIDLPLEPMIRALVRSNPPGAAQALAWRLQDARWPPAALALLAEGLEKIATTRERPLLALFFGRFRCEEPELADAVVAVARALVRLGSVELVKKVASEACDNAAMKERLGATADGTELRP